MLWIAVLAFAAGRDSLEGQGELGAGMERPYTLGLLAEALMHAGYDTEAMAHVEDALALPELRERSYSGRWSSPASAVCCCCVKDCRSAWEARAQA
jgi:hypothetical protein